MSATLRIMSVRFGCAGIACLLLPACQSQEEFQTSEADAPSFFQPQPMLATGSDHTITLFGEVPGVPNYGFESRAAVSLRQHSFPAEGSDFDPMVSRDGQQIIFASSRHTLTPDIYYKDVDGIAVTQLTTDPSSDVQPSWSPDGRRVAFASDRTGNWDIWVINLDGQQPVQVTSTSAHEVHPTWSPDGKWLVFCSMPERGGQWELWLASPETGARKKFIGYGLFPEWAPHSNNILFQRARRRGTRWFSIWKMQIVNGEPRMPTELVSSSDYALILPTWSPDEKQIAYCAVESVPSLPGAKRSPLQRADIWMVDADGRGPVRLTDGVGANYAPTWSTGGRIFFCSDRSADASQESVWSVVPLRAPMAAKPADPNNVYSRTDQQRADELRKIDDVPHAQTVSFPDKQ